MKKMLRSLAVAASFSLSLLIGTAAYANGQGSGAVAGGGQEQYGGGGHTTSATATATAAATAVGIGIGQGGQSIATGGQGGQSIATGGQSTILDNSSVTVSSTVEITEDPQRQHVVPILPGTAQPMGYLGSALDNNHPAGWFPIENGHWEQISGDKKMIEYESAGEPFFYFTKSPTKTMWIIKGEEVLTIDGGNEPLPLTPMGSWYVVLKPGQLSTAGDEVVKALGYEKGADVARIWHEEEVAEVVSTSTSNNSGAGLSILFGSNQLAGASGAYGRSATTASLMVPKKIRVNVIYYSLEK